MHITYKMARELYALGFSSRYDQENPNKQMLFYKDGVYFSIGGNSREAISDHDHQMLQGATWVPEMGDLINWLENNDFYYLISYTNAGRYVECIDQITGRKYTSEAPIPIAYALAANIKKILKHKEREFDTKTPAELGIGRIIDREMGEREE